MRNATLKLLVGATVSTLLVTPTAMSEPVKKHILPDVAAATYRYEVRIPLAITEYLPCTGEEVAVEGAFHILLHAAVNGNQVNLQEQYNPMGMSGAGALSGDTYRATGAEHLFTTFSVDGFPVNLGRVARYHFVGTGTAASFYLKHTQHLTMNANGEVTSSVDSFALRCE